MAPYATEAVPAGETCLVCDEAFKPEERGVPIKVNGISGWQHIHARCTEENIERLDWPARLSRQLKRVVARHGR